VFKMETHVADVVFDQVRERNGSVLPDCTFGGQGFIRNAFDRVRESHIRSNPQFHQAGPRSIGVTAEFDPTVSVVRRSCVTAVESREQEAHSIIGRGIDQVTQFLFAVPPCVSAGTDVSLVFRDASQPWFDVRDRRFQELAQVRRHDLYYVSFYERLAHRVELWRPLELRL